jgi:hypothetical protein
LKIALELLPHFVERQLIVTAALRAIEGLEEFPSRRGDKKLADQWT